MIYTLIVQEVLEKTIEVEASCFKEAKIVAKKMYDNGDILLDQNDLAHTYIQDSEGYVD